METEKHFLCDCGTELLQISYDDETNDVYFALFCYGHQDNRLSWPEIFRWCWHMVTKRKLFNDEIVFRKEKAREIGKYLLEITKEEA